MSQPESSFDSSLTEVETARLELESRIEAAGGPMPLRHISDRERLGIDALVDAVRRERPPEDWAEEHCICFGLIRDPDCPVCPPRARSTPEGQSPQ